MWVRTSIDLAAQTDLRPREWFYTSDMTISQARILSLRESLFKKYEVPDPGRSAADRANAAIKLWREMNDRCRTAFKIPKADSYLDDLLYEVQAEFRSNLGDWLGPKVKLQDAVALGRPGPGKSAGVTGTDFHWKMGVGEMTYQNPDLIEYYKVFSDSRWRSMECERASQSGDPKPALSEVFTVPKNSEIDRVALKEPSLEMYFQQGIGRQLEGILWQNHRISLEKQPNLNRHLAKIGSFTNEYGTIDLKSASDTISLKLVRWLMTDEQFRPFAKARSYYSDLGPLYMISSMGNAFTFPLQTLIFACVAKVSLVSIGVPLRGPNGLPNYSVFGDDIVIQRRAFARCCQLLERMGFIVNSVKSYNEGGFRESCGGDFFLGHGIRGVYIKKDLSHAPNAYSSFNRLVRWSVRYGIAIPNLLHSVKALARFRPVPFDAGDTAGHHWPRGLLSNIKTRRGLDFYRALEPVTVRRRVTGPPNGQLIAALGGYLTSFVRNVKGNSSYGVEIGIRPTHVNYKVVFGSTPSWDWIPHAGLNIRDYTLICMQM